MNAAAQSTQRRRHWSPVAAVTTSRSLVQVGLALGVAAAVAFLALTHVDALRAGGRSLLSGDGQWLALAVLATVAIWVAGTVTQLGSMTARPPVTRLFAVQVAASFVNHLLPAGSGGIAVNVRFLRRNGLSRRAAVGAVAVNSFAGLLTHLVLLVGAVAVAPSALASLAAQLTPHNVVAQLVPDVGAGHRPWMWAVLMLVLVLETALVLGPGPCTVAAWARRRLRAAAAGTRRETAGVVSVLRDPARAAKLWTGSFCVPLLHSVILLAVLRSVGDAVPATTVILTYLVASAVCSVLPSPGGFGALDVTLLAGFVAVGVPAPTALAAVLGYRFLTVWAPLLPGAWVFAMLVRRRII